MTPPNKITCILPIKGKTPGAWDIVVKNTDGKVGTKKNGFRITDPSGPTITGITPSFAPNAGLVKISNLAGTKFKTGATVTLTRAGKSDIVATNVKVASSGLITCTLPITGKTPGAWNIKVKNPDGRIGTFDKGFTIVDRLAPGITGITPGSARNTGPVTITNLAGTNFKTGAAVSLMRNGYPDIVATNIRVTPPKKITCILPIKGMTPGDWDIVVMNTDGKKGTKPDGFTISDSLAPGITGITPASAPNNVTVAITNLRGSNFQSGAEVFLTRKGYYDIYTEDVKVLSHSRITCRIPLRGEVSGTWNVKVVNPDGKFGTKTNGFTITAPAPAITEITPSVAPNSNNQGTTVSGRNFQEGVTVSLTRTGYAPITASDVRVSSSTNITCNFPLTGVAGGTWNVVVQNIDGKKGRKDSGFEIISCHFTLKWGSEGAGDGQFSNPTGITTDPNGNVLVVDFGNKRIQKFTSDGAFITKWGTEGTENGQFSHPAGITCDSQGNVFVADSGNKRVQKFTSDGAFITKWGTEGTGNGQFGSLAGITCDSQGNVYVLDGFNNQIQKFTSDGAFITKWGSSGTENGHFDYPAGITCDSQGNVYVADGYNNRIQKFTSDGTFITKWGSSGIGDGQFDIPEGIACDSQGNVFVGDSGNKRIQIFSSDGTFLVTWGSGGTGDGKLHSSGDIAIDSLRNIYVIDWRQSQIKSFR